MMDQSNGAIVNLHWLLHRARKIYWKVFQPTIRGAQTMLIDDGKILLVRLSYIQGWHLPGGGVDLRENYQQAAERELLEECGIRAEVCELFGMYQSSRLKNHTIGIYLVRKFNRDKTYQPDGEVVEQKFHSLSELPANVHGPARRRIEEYLGQREKTGIW